MIDLNGWIYKDVLLKTIIVSQSSQKSHQTNIIQIYKSRLEQIKFLYKIDSSWFESFWLISQLMYRSSQTLFTNFSELTLVTIFQLIKLLIAVYSGHIFVQEQLWIKLIPISIAWFLWKHIHNQIISKNIVHVHEIFNIFLEKFLIGHQSKI